MKLRKVLRLLLVAEAVVCLIGLAVVPSIRDSYKSRAVMTQRVQIDKAGAEMFGDGSTPIGSPQEMIIDDPKAVVGQPKEGIRQVDEAYLQAHHIYPLQMKTVDYAVRWANIILACCAVGGLGLAWLLGRGKRNIAPPTTDKSVE